MKKLAILSLVLLSSITLGAQDPIVKNSPWSNSITLGAADTTKTLQAGISGKTLFVTYVSCMSLVAAAQTIDIEATGGTIDVMKMAVSMTVNTQLTVSMTQGLSLGPGNSLLITPAAAGPSIFCIAEGYSRNN